MRDDTDTRRGGHRMTDDPPATYPEAFPARAPPPAPSTPPGWPSLRRTRAYPVAQFAPRVAAEYLPEFLSGDAWWGQGFSESEAGSDLAALRCRAIRRGDEYVISGHKIWTSHGETASRIVMLGPTGPPGSP